MSRPKKINHDSRVNMTIAPQLLAESKRLAYETDGTLSEMVERLLRQELAKSTNKDAYATREIKQAEAPKVKKRRTGT
jgi:hypothetical protein